MNQELKRTRLNAAFKRFQRLPSLLSKTEGRRSVSESAGWQPTQPQRAGVSTQTTAGVAGMQFLAE